MTRAKDSLHLIVPHRFFTYGQSAQGDPAYVRFARTLFIQQQRYCPSFECYSLAGCRGCGDGTAATRDRFDSTLARRMRSMWR